MRKEASGKKKEMAPKAAKPAVLSAEAAAMEVSPDKLHGCDIIEDCHNHERSRLQQKLVELRKAMEKERAKREAVM